MRTKVYIILGLPGAGKGICAQELKSKKGFFHFSLGDYLRGQVKHRTKVGKKYTEAINSGLSLIPCNIAFRIVQKIIKDSLSYNKNIIIDGFPRTLNQLDLLEKFLSKHNIVSHWFYFDVEPEIGIKRLLTREHCASCEYDFIMVSTKVSGICDFCLKPLIKRSTDNRESLLNRIALFHKTTYHVIEKLKATNSLITINTNKDIDSLKKDFFAIEDTIANDY